ncbi:hypothetical protein FRC01_001350 [Tulasnella sp. 417]|nr:hypothetical protein FRC01_001350 [Tulasnella sp. 417]
MHARAPALDHSAFFVPPTFQASPTSGAYGPQSSVVSVPTPSHIGQAEAPNLLQHQSGTPAEENDEQHVEPGTSSQSPEIISQDKFPFQVYKMLQDERMNPYICWAGTDSFYIPEIENFVENALSVYFRGQKDGWNSFWKQLRNYQFEKRACDLGGYTFTHLNKKFSKDGKNLHEVVSKPKQPTASTPRVVAQAPTPGLHASYLPSIAPLSPSQAALHARLSQLELTILELKEGLVRTGSKGKPTCGKGGTALDQRKTALDTRKTALSKGETTRSQGEAA